MVFSASINPLHPEGKFSQHFWATQLSLSYQASAAEHFPEPKIDFLPVFCTFMRLVHKNIIKEIDNNTDHLKNSLIPGMDPKW